MVDGFKILSRIVGPGAPCFIVAEAGVNHNGRIDLARELIELASESGADAVKFQTFRAEKLVTPLAPKADYQKKRTDRSESQFDMLRRLALSDDAHVELVEYCRHKGILFMSTPFDEESADFLSQLDMAVFKLPSGEITNLPFIEHVGRIGKPILLSTGMSDLSDVYEAVHTIHNTGNRQLALLHCVSSYPAPPSDMNLRAMKTLSENFGVPVGLSDHTEGVEIALAAVALGACVVEKHFTLDRRLPGPDHEASLDPLQLRDLVKGIRKVEEAMGTGIKQPAESERDASRAARRSLVAAQDVAAGSVMTDAMIACLRPGTGLPPSSKKELVGKQARIDFPAGTILTREMFK